MTLCTGTVAGTVYIHRDLQVDCGRPLFFLHSPRPPHWHTSILSLRAIDVPLTERARLAHLHTHVLALRFSICSLALVKR